MHRTNLLAAFIVNESSKPDPPSEWYQKAILQALSITEKKRVSTRFDHRKREVGYPVEYGLCSRHSVPFSSSPPSITEFTIAYTFT